MGIHANIHHRTKLSALALSVAFALTSTGVSAQEADSSNEQSVTLEIIEVTANKRTQTLQEIPASITAVSGDSLQARGITNPTELDKIVPGMFNGVGNRGEATINIRGVGYNEVGSPGVAVHIDGVYQPRAGMGIISQIDVARVEVLRGPQSTLYGRNANGGVVNYLSAAPTGELEGEVAVTLANYDQTQLTGTLNVPLNDDWSARVSVSHLQRDEGLWENILPDGEDTGKIDKSFGARLSINGYITDDISLKLIATTSEFEGNPMNNVFIDRSYNPAFATQTLAEGDFQISHGRGNLVEQSYDALTAIVNVDMQEWTFVSTTGYQDYSFDRFNDSDFLEIDAVVNQVAESSTTFTQEFNLAGRIGNVDSVFGLFYMDDQAEYGTFFYFPAGFGPFPAAPINQDFAPFEILAPQYDLTSVAVFTDLTWNVSDDFRIIGGIRWSDDQQDIVQSTRQGPVQQCLNLKTDFDVTATIGRLGAQYDVSSNSNVFGTVSQGLKTGGVNFRSGCADTFEDEEITSFELGYKMTTDDRRFTTNITGFFYDYTDLQTQQIIGLNAAIANAPGAEITGLEIDTQWQPDDYWNITANLSLMNAEYSEDFINANQAIAPMGPPPTPSPSANVNGNPLNFAPDVAAMLAVSYTTDPVIADGTMDFRLSVNYRSEVTLREFNLEGDFNEPTTVLAASTRWLSESELYSVRVYVENLTDEAFFTNMNASGLNGGRFATWNTPRQFGVEFKAAF